MKRRLFESPQAFELFQLLRLLERLAASEAVGTERPWPDPIGDGVDSERAPVQVKASISLGFAAAEVTALRRSKHGRGGVELTQTLIGMSGSTGVLPSAWSEIVQLSVRERNFALRGFLDIFNDRLAALLYGAYAKYRPVLTSERAHVFGRVDKIDVALSSLVGFGSTSVEGLQSGPLDPIVFFGGHFSKRNRSAVAIRLALESIVGARVAIEQFDGEWLPIDAQDRTRLPCRSHPSGNFCRLGQDAVVGARTYDVVSGVVLSIGPLDYEAFRSLLPDGSRARAINEIFALAVGAEKRFRVRLALRRDEVPRLRAGGEGPRAPRLGWNTWLGEYPASRGAALADFRPDPHLR